MEEIRKQVTADVYRHYTDIQGRVKVSETTIKVRIDHYMKVYETIGDPIKNKMEFMEWISKMKPTSGKFYCDAVFTVHDGRGDMDPELNRYCIAVAKHSNETPKKTPDATIEDLKAAVDYYKPLSELKGPLSRETDAYLIAAFYYEMPLRNELWSLKIRNFDQMKDNFIHNGKLILNTYKTSGCYGQKCYDIPSYIQDVIRTIATADTNRTYLFYNQKGAQYTGQDMTKRIKKIYNDSIGKEISMTSTRKIKINNEYKGVKTLEDIQEVSDRYNHSVGVEIAYYVSKETSESLFKEDN